MDWCLHMSLPAQTGEIYRVGTLPVVGIGVRLVDAHFDDAMVKRLKDMHHLSEQRHAIADLLKRSASSQFADARLKSALEAGRLEHETVLKQLAQGKVPENDWRLGETLGREYLERRAKFKFPITATQDARNQNGSLPGTDYVGFRMCDDDVIRFAFGEVKTSRQDQRPPSVMWGRGGMIGQLIDLLPDERGAWDQILYLGMRVEGTKWEDAFASAYASFDANNLDFEMVGVLIRPRPSHTDEKKDLEVRCAALAKRLATHQRGALLLGIYVGEKTFANLRSRWATI
jgi:hypothetical protein